MKIILAALIVLNGSEAPPLASNSGDLSLTATDMDFISVLVARVTDSDIISVEIFGRNDPRIEEIDEIRNTRQDINARILVLGGGNIEVFHAHRTSDGWDFTDADLVAFRIREAARQEKDAETRRKLWEEYGNYSLSAFGNCRLCDRDVLEASTALAGRGAGCAVGR